MRGRITWQSVARAKRGLFADNSEGIRPGSAANICPPTHPTMRLSIIIPVFNAGAYLLPLLASLRQLPGEDIEFIAVDDGSTDHSPATLFAHAARDSRFWVIQQTNAGVAVARNRGLQQFRVRGLQRVKAVVLLFALAHNLAREESLKKKVLTG